MVSVVKISRLVRIFEVFVGIGVEQKKFCERVYVADRVSFGGAVLRWGGSSEAGGRLTDNLIGEEMPPFLLRMFNPTFLQCEVFQGLHI